MFTISVYRVIRYRDHITTAGNCNNNHEHFIMCDWRQPITQSATYHNNNREHFILGGYHITTVNYNNNREHFILGCYHIPTNITTTIVNILFWGATTIVDILQQQSTKIIHTIIGDILQQQSTVFYFVCLMSIVVNFMLQFGRGMV